MATAADPLTENPEFFTHEIRKSVLRDPPRDRGYPPGLVPLSFALRRAVARRRRRDGAILPPTAAPSPTAYASTDGGRSRLTNASTNQTFHRWPTIATAAVRMRRGDRRGRNPVQVRILDNTSLVCDARSTISVTVVLFGIERCPFRHHVYSRHSTPKIEKGSVLHPWQEKALTPCSSTKPAPSRAPFVLFDRIA